MDVPIDGHLSNHAVQKTQTDQPVEFHGLEIERWIVQRVCPWLCSIPKSFLNIDDTGLKLDYACQIIAKNLDAILRIYSVGFITSFSGIAKFVVNDCLPFNSDVSMDVRRE